MCPSYASCRQLASRNGLRNWECGIDHCSDVTDCKSVKGGYSNLQYSMLNAMENWLRTLVEMFTNYYFFITIDFKCLGYIGQAESGKNKLCVPNHCDSSYNCPHPYFCDLNTGKCTYNATVSFCKQDNGMKNECFFYI